MMAENRTVTHRCTPENAPLVRAIVQSQPQLHQLVKDLQAANLFPGLRGLSFRITGSEKQLAKGLAALLPENAPEGVKTAQQG